MTVWPALYIFRWDRHGRKGQRCRVTARGKMNSIRVEFEDGFVMVTSGNAIWKAPPASTGETVHGRLHESAAYSKGVSA